MNFQDFVSILRGRWRVAGGIFAVVLFSALALTFILPKQYVATAEVIADNTRTDPLVTRSSDQSAIAYMATQVAIINSDRIARDVAAAVQFDSRLQLEPQWKKATHGRTDFPTWFSRRLHKVLKVAPTGEGSVIGITVKWTDAQAAAILTNDVADTFIKTSIEMRVQPAKQYASWFNEQSQSLRADLEAKQRRLDEFLQNNNIMPTEERVDTESARLAGLSNQLVTVQTQQIDSQTSLQQGLQDADATSEVLQSPLIAGLKADLARAEAKQQSISMTLGTSHPEYRRNEAEIESLRSRIDGETHNVVASFGNTTRVRERREAQLTAAIQVQKTRLLELKHSHDQAALLEADVQGARRNLDAVSQRQAQTNLEGSSEQSSVTLLAAAVTPDGASSPRLALNGVLGLFFGGILGVGAALLLELSDRRVRSSDDLESLLAGVPVLARIAAVPIPYRLSSDVGLLESGT